MMNIYQLGDFFHINEQDMENIDEKLKTLGRVLKFFREISFSYRYPNKQVKVEVFEEDDGELLHTMFEILLIQIYSSIIWLLFTSRA